MYICICICIIPSSDILLAAAEKKMMKGLAATVEENMSNLTSASNEQASGSSSSNRNDNNGGIYFPPLNPPQPLKRKRNQPGHPDPSAEVIALSPKTLMATNRFVCEICNKGFQRDQNLQLHRRGHNLPWKLKQRSSKEVIRKKVYVCPEVGCVHHDPSRALGDLTGIKKHFSRKHGEKKWKCDKCSKKYAVQSDWKAHSKTCGTREYRCDCGTLFSRRDSFITHRAFCDALAEESARSVLSGGGGGAPPGSSSISAHHQTINLQFPNQEIPFQNTIKKEHHHHHQSFTLIPEIQQWRLPPCPPTMDPRHHHHHHVVHGGPPLIDLTPTPSSSSSIFQDFQPNPNPSSRNGNGGGGPTTPLPPYHHPPPPPHISATALLQKAAQMGSKSSTTPASPAGAFIIPHHHNQQGHVTASAGHDSDSTTGFGLNLSSRDDFTLNGLGNKAAASAARVTGGDGSTVTVTGASPPGGTNINITNNACSSFLHEMMMMNSSSNLHAGFEEGGSSFDEESFRSFHATLGNFSSTRSSNSATANEGGGGIGTTNDGMMTTRDFLGLRPLSQSDILSMAGLSNCINTDNNSNHAACINVDRDQNQTTEKSWQV
ncbi:hypothetical protein ABFS82_09G118500 [Erythranthe guttata]|uniref:protein indeterminate-domain 7 isoform X1 n=2 Tax=Erythranthe guttata TaxID=4155 RepID=UPI00064D9089|nr:PREDICTED: protein indeterminate-domain 7 isoform X1 [Erythranthe guttata]|eukprot:XP_012856308.1 PREDICTED: protein indeterminate-domain 7 isoform X1 [Erythranthe guttata]